MKIQQFSVYDRTWIMHNNMPVERIVYSVIHTMDTISSPPGTRITYKVVNGLCGNATSRNPAISCDEERMFHTKEALLESL